jgi:hypothetical protein
LLLQGRHLYLREKPIAVLREGGDIEREATYITIASSLRELLARPARALAMEVFKCQKVF